MSGSGSRFSLTKTRWMIVLLLLFVFYWFSLPSRLFNEPYSTVLESSSGALLSAAIAEDGQWRFPPDNNLPDKFKRSIIAFEDKRFYGHPGVDVIAMGRALKQNMRHGKVISGGSTITMQVIRLSRKGMRRSLLEKCRELILATRLELSYSKQEILSLYAAHAPFGGNVVGLEAACWRYFGRNASDLSWGEAAMLAVLPNAPSLMHPGKNRDALKLKRDLLLEKLLLSGVIDSFSCVLAKAEAIPEEPLPLPRSARHLMTRMSREGYAQQKVTSTIDISLQHRVEQILSDHHRRLSGNEIHNAAAIVARINSGEVVAYVGNVSSKPNEGAEVDIVTSPRSTGSILKPFLYAAMLDDGRILPGTLLPDVPTFINGFTPKNFTKEYDGAVGADKALIRSLNVPAVHMLREYRYERFHSLLKNMGMTTLKKPADHYGLSLILGGAEGTLWDVAGMYASMARTMNNYFTHPGKNRYDKQDFHPLRYVTTAKDRGPVSETSWISAPSIYNTFESLTELYRPGDETGWRYFESAKKIAWKTGTSFGFRDGWAIGVTPEYVVAVWVGNADGEGRPGLTGTDAAAPVLFDIFSQLEGYTWFKRPAQEMKRITVCRSSGYRDSPNCHEKDSVWVGATGLETPSCPYHKKIYLTRDRQFQVNTSCANINDMVDERWFVLNPIQEYYYKRRNTSYKSLPPFQQNCSSTEGNHFMDLVYPKQGSKLFIPRGLSGEAGSVVVQVAHRNPQATVFWHLDGNYIGSTQKNHQFAVNPSAGKHVILVMDDAGESIEHQLEILSGL